MQKNTIYFDIGANYGNRIGPALKLGVKKVVAVEPQKLCCEYLKKAYPRVEILQKGVGAERGKKQLYISDQDVLSTFSSEFITLTGDGRFKETKWNNGNFVEILTLDDLIGTYGIPGFIKIDVEGYEFEVISGLNQKVGILSFEYTTPELAHKLEPILFKLRSLGEYHLNYSVAETMKFQLERWLSPDESLKLIRTNKFLDTGFGDIYIRYD